MGTKIKKNRSHVIAFGLFIALLAMPATAVAETRSATDFEVDGTTLVAYRGDDAIVEVPDGVVTIGERVFEGNETVEKIILPDSVKYVEKMALTYAPKLREIVIGAGLENMYNCEFTATPSLETITVSSRNMSYYVEDGILRENGAWSDRIYYYPAQKKDSYYAIPDDVTLIDFCGNQYLEHVYISENVRDINLSCTSSLETIEVSPKNPYFTVYDGVLYNKDMTAIVRYPSARKDKNFYVPDTVKEMQFEQERISGDSIPNTKYLTDIFFDGAAPRRDSSGSWKFYDWYSAFEPDMRYAPYPYYIWTCGDSMAQKTYRIHYPAEESSWNELIEAYDNRFGAGTRYFELEFVPYGKDVNEDGSGGGIVLNITGTADYDAAYEVLQRVNQLRQDQGLDALVMDKGLLEAAMQRAAELSISYSHTRPDGSESGTVIPSYYMACGENIAVGQSTAEEAFNDWKGSSGHYANMVGRNFSAVGIGCFYQNGVKYWSQVFAGGGNYDSGVRPMKSEKAFVVKSLPEYLALAVKPSNLTISMGAKNAKLVLRNRSNRDLGTGYDVEIMPTYIESLNPDCILVNEDGTISPLGKVDNAIVRIGVSDQYYVEAKVIVSDTSGVGFTAQQTYRSGMFQDVKDTAWYGNSVKTAYELGLVKGISEDCFNPDGEITLAESITLAARIHSIYNTGAENFVQGTPWYRTYVEYCVANGIIGQNEYTNYNVAAMREQFAAIMANAMPGEAFAAINKIDVIPDVSRGSAHAEAIYKLYNAGILTGSDEYGTFNPTSNIRRSEVATIVTRMAAEELRQRI